MNDAQARFLALWGGAPARLTAEQAAWVLNCQPHDIPVLVAARLLKPLGNPAPNAMKYFAAPELLESSRDQAWLGRITQALQQHWRHKNSRRTPEDMAPGTPSRFHRTANP
jgi:hypothetical protein